MKRAERLRGLLILGLLLPLLARSAEVDTRWQARGQQARLELGATSGSAQEPLVLNVALPPAGNWRVTSLEIDGRRVDPEERLRLGRPFVYRRVRAGQLLFDAGDEPWRRAVIGLAFDRPLPAAGKSPADPALAGLLVNPEQAVLRQSEPPASGGRESDEIFDGSSRWIRIDVRHSAVYHLSYDQLWQNGVALGTDTGTFRLLGTGGRGQPFRMGWPGGSWEPGWQFQEIPLQVKGGASFNQSSELSFYLPGVDGFESEYGPGADWEDYHRNPYALWATYYLTWDGAAGERVASLDAAPTGLDPVLATLPAKLHREENFVYSNKHLHEDGWAWHYFYPSSIPDQFGDLFAMSWPDASQPFGLRVGYDAPRDANFSSGPHHVIGYLGQLDENHLLFDEVFSISSTLSQALLEGERVLPADMDGLDESEFLLVLPRDPEAMADDFGYLLWYEVFYQTRPRTRYSTPLELYVPADEASAEIRVTAWEHEPEVWDVTDPCDVHLLTGGVWSGDSLRLRLDTSDMRHLVCVDPQAGVGYLSPERVRQVTPTLLRNDAGRPHMIVVYFDDFSAAAERYAGWRRGHFPLLGNGEVETVAISDIYANFSSGMQDPAALRNFLKYRYDTEGSRLTYVLLLGDADYDYRNFLGRETLGDGTNCLVPALSDRFRSDRLTQPYTTDDYISCLDVEDDSVEVSVPDLAAGRLPAGSLEMAEQMVDMVIAYESENPAGAWRNKIILAADDYYIHCHQFDGIGHTVDAEILFEHAYTNEQDVEKIYLCEWDCDYAGFKPLAQQQLFGSLDGGALIFNYVGHGGNDVLADEQLLLTSSLYSLSNEERRFFFISASCNVGKYDDPSNQSMSETMLSLPGGGAIGTMASSALSGAHFNNVLNRNFLQAMFPDGSLPATVPIGLSLLRAKVKTQLVDMNNSIGTQNERYAILGDPALSLGTPRLQIEFDDSRADTLKVGSSLSLSGRVMRDGLFAPDFTGELLLSVRASADTSGYVYYIDEEAFHVDYHLAGPEIFRGRVTVMEGRFESPSFFVPGLPDSSLGPYGRIRAYAMSGLNQAVGVLTDLHVVPGILPADDTPPQISLSLAGGATHGSPGVELILRATSPSGINFVGTHPHNAIFLEYVEAGQVENLTGRFEYDMGSASSGEVRSTLPAGLPSGANTLVASVADNLGNVGRDTLRVHVFEEGRADLLAVQPFPNPFDRRCAISFELTAAAGVECSIYTVSGRRVWRREQNCSAPGRYAFDWNGRDETGDEVGSGTYLYRLVASYNEESTRRRERTGAIVRIRD